MLQLKEYTLKEFESFLVRQGEPAFRARQLFSWVYQKGVSDLDRMLNLPAVLRQKLQRTVSLSALSLVEKQVSSDGTEKFLFRLHDGHLIETVAIPAQGRVTGCVSSQAGCKFGCAFCCSGKGGFKRDLTCAEIVDQIVFLRFQSSGRELTHLVFMGMGEPLDNYDNVLKAIRMINAPDPDWPETLRGPAADVYARWGDELKPRGFGLAARDV